MSNPLSAMVEVKYDEPELLQTFLPHGPMLQVHRILSIEHDLILAERRVSEEDWFFPVHFPKDPIFPGSLLIEGAGQVVAMWGWNAGLRGKPRLVKTSAEFRNPVFPQDQLLTYAGRVKKRNNICIGTVEITVKDRPIGTISATIVVLKD